MEGLYGYCEEGRFVLFLHCIVGVFGFSSLAQ